MRSRLKTFARLVGTTSVAIALAGAPGAARGAMITYATYLGGTGDEAETPLDGEVHIARDGVGNVYLTGTTGSVDFPTTPGANRALNGSTDVFVTKISPTGAIVYSTYLGGPCEDYGRSE